MKEKIHPEYYPNATVTCGCGNTFMIGSTRPTIRVEICSSCHPFFTGEQRIVDTAGQVERFMRRLERRQEAQTPAATEAAAEEVEQAEEATVE